ncbi:hypothetical protein V8C86DRAFT_816748 [Haematococcus lacustris]
MITLAHPRTRLNPPMVPPNVTIKFIMLDQTASSYLSATGSHKTSIFRQHIAAAPCTSSTTCTIPALGVEGAGPAHHQTAAHLSQPGRRAGVGVGAARQLALPCGFGAALGRPASCEPSAWPPAAQHLIRSWRVGGWEGGREGPRERELGKSKWEGAGWASGEQEHHSWGVQGRAQGSAGDYRMCLHASLSQSQTHGSMNRTILPAPTMATQPHCCCQAATGGAAWSVPYCARRLDISAVTGPVVAGVVGGLAGVVWRLHSLTVACGA